MRSISLMAVAVAVAGVVSVSVSAPAWGQSMRCGRRLVSVGDTAYELERRCGAPAHRTVIVDFRAVTVRDRRGFAIQQVVDEDIDVLTYPGGDGDLPRIVTLRRGFVDSIRTGDRVQSTSDKRCAQAVLRRRATSGEVHLACGRPSDRSRWTEERAIQIRGQVVRRRVTFERWVYDPGPGNLLRILRFENGRLVDIKTGGRSPSRD